MPGVLVGWSRSGSLGLCFESPPMAGPAEQSTQDTREASSKTPNIAQRPEQAIVSPIHSLAGDTPDAPREVLLGHREMGPNPGEVDSTSFFVPDRGASSLDPRRAAGVGRQTVDHRPIAIDDQTAEEIIRQTLGGFVTTDDP
eukprot:Gb_28186 [translate_table: standard]